MSNIDYMRLYEWSSSRPGLVRALRATHAPAVLLVALSYCVELVLLALTASIGLAAIMVAVSAAPFLLVSAMRRLIGAPRPYEIYDLSPYELGKRGRGGDSFPSRHTFSAFFIGALVLPSVPALGAVVLLLGVYIAVSRVLLGIHFIRDVCAGAAIGVVTGIIGACFLYLYS